MGVAWLGAVVASAACSGKTTDGAESMEAASGGAATGTAGTGSGASSASGAEPGNAGGGAWTGGDSGTGGASGSLFGCGAVSCVEGKSYCYNYTPGTPGQQARAECKRLTEECTDCACLCPAVTPDGQCSGLGDDLPASCLCGGETGKIVISCFGS